MNPCFETSENRFLCEEIKIKCAFSESVYKDYKKKRFGITSCKPGNSEEYWDLMQLLDYNLNNSLQFFDKNTYRNELYVNESLKGLVSQNQLKEYFIKTLQVCNISKILEKINSLK